MFPKDMDIQGRQYVRIDALKDGQTVWLDGGFPCHRPGPIQIVGHGRNASFQCAAGSHKVDGQSDGNGAYCIGIYVSDPGPMEWGWTEEDLK